MENLKKEYRNLYGIWRVFDEYGEYLKELGLYEGWVDDIAFHLADKSCGCLRFCVPNIKKIGNESPKCSSVHISFNIDAMPLDYYKSDCHNEAKSVSVFRQLFKNANRLVSVGDGSYFGSVLLKTTQKTQEELKQEAMNKLSIEDRRLLGLL